MIFPVRLPGWVKRACNAPLLAAPATLHYRGRDDLPHKRPERDEFF